MDALARRDDIFEREEDRRILLKDMPGSGCFHGLRKQYPVVAYYWKEHLCLFLSVALIGGMFGLSKLMFPILGQVVFHHNASTILMFIVAFGVTKGLCSAIIGVAADECGRTNILRVGWLFGLPVFPLIMTATSWTQVIVANTLLGVHQGITWTTSILMMLDLTDNADRATMIGSNEFLGFFMVALVTLLSSLDKSKSAAMQDFDVAFWGGLAMTLAGSVIAVILPETRNADHSWILERHDEEFGDEILDQLEKEAEKMDPHERAREEHLWKVNRAHLERNTKALIEEAKVKPSDAALPTTPSPSPLAAPSTPTEELKLTIDDSVASPTPFSPEVSNSASGLEALSPVDPNRMYEVASPSADGEDTVGTEPTQPDISISSPARPPPFANFMYVFKLLYDTGITIWEVSTTSLHIASALFAGWATGAKEGAIWGLSPLFFKSFNFTMEQIGILLGLYFFTLSLSKILVGYFADRGAGKMLVLGGMFLEVFSLLYYAWAPDLTLIDTPPHHAYPLFLTSSIIMGLGHAAIVPTLQHAMIQHVPKARQGAVLGVFRMWLGFGLCAGAGLGGYIADVFNFSVSFSIIAAVMFLSIVVVIIVMVDIPSQHSATAKLRTRYGKDNKRRRQRAKKAQASPPVTKKRSTISDDDASANNDEEADASTALLSPTLASDDPLTVRRRISATSQRNVAISNSSQDNEPDIFPASDGVDEILTLLDDDDGNAGRSQGRGNVFR